MPLKRHRDHSQECPTKDTRTYPFVRLRQSGEATRQTGMAPFEHVCETLKKRGAHVDHRDSLILSAEYALSRSRQSRIEQEPPHSKRGLFLRRLQILGAALRTLLQTSKSPAGYIQSFAILGFVSPPELLSAFQNVCLSRSLQHLDWLMPERIESGKERLHEGVRKNDRSVAERSEAKCV